MMGPTQVIALPDLQPVLANADVYVFSHATSDVSSGVLPVAILGATRPQSVAIQFRQDAKEVTLKVTKSDQPINASQIKLDEEPLTFSVMQADGTEVSFGGNVADGHLVITAATDTAKDIAIHQLPSVVAAAVTTLSENSRVTIIDLKGVLLDLR